MVEKQIDKFEFIYLADPRWRTKARSHLTRSQRSTKSRRSRVTIVNQNEARSRHKIVAFEDAQARASDKDDTERKVLLALAKQGGPWSLLDPSLADAFGTLPIAGLGKFERVAMDHCVNGLGYSNYHFRPRSFPFNALLQEAIADPACLHILIAKTAHHLDTVRYLSDPKAITSAIIEPSREMLWHKAQGMQMLQRRIANTVAKPDPMTIQAVLFLAELEDRFGYQDAAVVHLTGLRRMVDSCGGFLAFAQEPKLQLQLAWVEITHFGSFESEVVNGSAENPEAQILQALFSNLLLYEEECIPTFDSSSFISKILLASRPYSSVTGYKESMRLNIHLAILFYLYLHITSEKADKFALAKHSSQIASFMRQYAAPGGEAFGVLLWILMTKSTTEQRYDFQAGIAALGDPSRTFIVLKLLRLARRQSWSSRIALITALTAKLLVTGSTVQREPAVQALADLNLGLVADMPD